MSNDVIKESLYFKGLNDEEFKKALDYFEAREVKFTKGDILNKITKPMDYFGLVLDGCVQVYMDDMDGNQIIMANNLPGDSFGESLCYLEKEAPVYIMALSDGAYLRMKTNHLKTGTCGKLELELKHRFISILANRTLNMNNRIQILSKISIREKLMTFFAEYCKCGTVCEFELPFDRNDMAIYLGVNRSALSRELSNMQAEGLISFHKNKFKLLKL